MRADGVLRVMLNTPIFKGMTVGDPQGNEPKSKQIHLASLESGRSVPILLRVSLIFPNILTVLTDPCRCRVKTSRKSYIMSSVVSWKSCDCRIALLFCVLFTRSVLGHPLAVIPTLSKVQSNSCGWLLGLLCSCRMATALVGLSHCLFYHLTINHNRHPSINLDDMRYTECSSMGHVTSRLSYRLICSSYQKLLNHHGPSP